MILVKKFGRASVYIDEMPGFSGFWISPVQAADAGSVLLVRIEKWCEDHKRAYRVMRTLVAEAGSLNSTTTNAELFEFQRVFKKDKDYAELVRTSLAIIKQREGLNVR